MFCTYTYDGYTPTIKGDLPFPFLFPFPELYIVKRIFVFLDRLCPNNITVIKSHTNIKY